MKWLSLLIIVLLVNCLNAQEKKASYQDLEKILFDLESRFKVHFSYESNIVKDYKLPILDLDTLNLQPNLITIEKLTNLEFKEIGLRKFVVVSKNFISSKLNICGYLLNKGTGLPINKASISVFGKHKTITNSKGFFKIDSIGVNDALEILQKGVKYKLLKAQVFKEKKCRKIALDVESVVLNEVIINNYMSRGFSKKNDGSIISQPSKIGTIPGLVAPDILQSIQLFPGVQSPNETATGLNIRGDTPDQNLVIYDGIKMYNYNHFFGMLSIFNPYILEKIEFSKGGSSSKYRNHVSGVLDLTSVSSIPKKISGGASVNMIYADAFIKLPISKNFGIVASGRSSFANLFQTISFDAYSDFVFQNTKITDNLNIFNQSISKVNSDYNFSDFTIKLLSKIGAKSELDFSTIYSKNNLDFLSELKEINRFTSDKLRIENFGFSLNYKSTWSNKLKSFFSVALSSHNFDYQGEEILEAFFNYETEKRNHVKDLNLSLDINYKINDKQRILSGYDFVKNDISYAYSNVSDVIFNKDFFLKSADRQNSSHDLYSEYRFNNKKFFFRAGMRSTYFSSLKTVYLQGNINANLKLNPFVTLNFNAEKKNQFVSQIIEFETQNLGLENQIWIVSNTEIPVLEKKQLGLSLVYNKNKFYFDLEGYYKKSDGITSLFRGFNDNLEGLTNGKSETKGLELLLKKEFNKLSTSVSYALTNNEYTFKHANSKLKFDGNFDIRHYLSVINSIRFNKLELSVGWRYRTSRPFTPVKGLIGNTAETIKIDFDKINSGRLGNYSRFDFSGSYTFKPFFNNKIKGKIGVSILNLLNTENNLSRSHRIVVDLDTGSYKIREINKFSIRRTPNFMFHIEF